MPPLRFEFALEFLTPAFIGGAALDNKARFHFKTTQSPYALLVAAVPGYTGQPWTV